ncbi:MAG TPA: hypothetical protein VND97_01945, partial [Beijerinckiaceae bacterium]|nr:hypothetical protein [Beijerinckiaceae bacterium]
MGSIEAKPAAGPFFEDKVRGARAFPKYHPSLRSATLIGTALGTGILAASVLSVQPALAGTCTPGTGTVTCSGTFPTGISFTGQSADLTIVTDAATIGNPGGSGIALTAGTAGLTLGVTTDEASTIGTTPGYAVTNDGIFVGSGYNNTTIAINSAAPIGSAAAPVDYNGIAANISARGISAQSIVIDNSSAIYAGAAHQPGNDEGIRAYIHQYSMDSASSAISVTNSAAVHSYGDAIYGFVYDGARFIPASGVSSSASVTIANSGDLASADGDGVHGATGVYAYSVGFVTISGGALASTIIDNTGAVTSAVSLGIQGSANAGSNASGFNATAGTSSANTAITNSGTIGAYEAGIGGYAKSTSEALFSIQSLGGSSTAGVTIDNMASVTSSNSYGVNGRSYADSRASGVYATGGTAHATTTIINTGAVASSDDALDGHSTAKANAERVYGGTTYSTQGGSAYAVTTITNSAQVQSSQYEGIDSGARSYAYARSYAGVDVATGGNAHASALIYNTGVVTAPATQRDGTLYGHSYASAGAIGHTAIGGKAYAATKIVNSGALQGGPGINGLAFADSYARDYTNPGGAATGGLADASVLIVNSDAITSTGAYGTGISGNAKAYAQGYSRSGSATGGTANANVVITNSGHLASSAADGIYGKSYADAKSSSHSGVNATAGSAIATTYVGNLAAGSATTTAAGDSAIEALSQASATGAAGILAGYAKAVTIVSNAGALRTSGAGSPAIYAAAYAHSGLTAIADVSVVNSGSITTSGAYAAGAIGYAFATGDASATTTMINSGSILTLGATSPGLGAASLSYALVGPATATTNVINSGSILTLGATSPGVLAYAGAIAPAGTASAVIDIVNSGSIQSDGANSPAILAYVVTGTPTSTITIANSG